MKENEEKNQEFRGVSKTEGTRGPIETASGEFRRQLNARRTSKKKAKKLLPWRLTTALTNRDP